MRNKEYIKLIFIITHCYDYLITCYLYHLKSHFLFWLQMYQINTQLILVLRNLSEYTVFDCLSTQYAPEVSLYVRSRSQFICALQKSVYMYAPEISLYVRSRSQFICALQKSFYMCAPEVSLYVRSRSQFICALQKSVLR